VRGVAADYPDTAFAFGSCCEEQAPNFSVFDNWMQDPGYLAGMLAGGLTESGTIGVVAAMPIPEVNRIVNAFVMGVAETNPDATVNVSFINSFFDPATAAQAAEAQIAQGADILFAERAGVIEVADEHDLPVFGMMVDQQELAPDNVVTSLVWNMRPTVEALVEQVADGSYEAQNLAQYSFMVNGGSSIAPINTDVVVEVPEELVALVEERQAEILSGDFETPIDEEAPEGSIDVTE
jgi:basic membrane lipoprotein Med (substrate-binding protein (PBP1-ABC) superfamily)